MELRTRTWSDPAAQSVRQGSDATLEATVAHILFADIVGFSKLSMEEQSRAERELRSAASRTEGFELGLRNGELTSLDTGDGFAFAFEGNPLAPAKVALELAALLADASFRVRIGLHSGPVARCLDIAGKPNVKGVGMNVAQRVMDAATPGQILISEHFASVLRSFDGWPNLVVPLGARKVKHGLRLRLCELTHPNGPKRSALAGLLTQEIPPVPLSVKWLGILLIFAACAGSLWSAAQAKFEQESASWASPATPSSSSFGTAKQE